MPQYVSRYFYLQKEVLGVLAPFLDVYCKNIAILGNSINTKMNHVFGNVKIMHYFRIYDQKMI